MIFRPIACGNKGRKNAFAAAPLSHVSSRAAFCFAKGSGIHF